MDLNKLCEIMKHDCISCIVSDENKKICNSATKEIKKNIKISTDENLTFFQNFVIINMLKVKK